MSLYVNICIVIFLVVSSALLGPAFEHSEIIKQIDDYPLVFSVSLSSYSPYSLSDCGLIFFGSGEHKISEIRTIKSLLRKLIRRKDTVNLSGIKPP